MPAYLLYGKGKSRYESGSSGLSDGAFSGGYQGNDGNLYPYSLRGCGGGTASSGQPEIMSEWEKVKRDFYESNGLEDDEPAEKPVQRAFDKNKKQDTGSMYTKSWDRREVQKALQIKDDDKDSAGFDTSLF